MFGNSAPATLMKAVADTIDFTEAEVKRGIYLIGAACYTQIYGKAVTKQVVREINVAESLPRFLEKAIHVDASMLAGHVPAAMLHHFHAPRTIHVPPALQQSITSTIYNAVHPFQILKLLAMRPSWSLPTVFLLLRNARGKIARILLRQLWKLILHGVSGAASGLWGSDDSDDDF